MSTSFPLRRSVLGAMVIIAVSAALPWLAPHYISVELSHRLLGAMLGAVVVVYSNAIPKLLVGSTSLRCSPAADQAARRFAGWSLVLGGIAYMLAWLLAPLDMAGLIGGALLATSLLLAVARCLRVRGNGSAT
jgi:hypothetical protein